MKPLLVTAVLGLCVYMSWDKIQSLAAGGPEPLRESPYVLVYGRDSCGTTQRTLNGLSRARIPYEYRSVDRPGVGDELHPRMEAAGLDTRRYWLPVVDVSAKIRVRPSVDSIRDDYREAVLARARSRR